jgi:uncharacterized protein YecT (DUF1311 family)
VVPLLALIEHFADTFPPMLKNNSDRSAIQTLFMNPVKIIAYCVLLLVGISLPTIGQQEKEKPEPCANVQSQGEMNICWGNEYKQADVELNQIYRKLLSMVDGEQKEQLKEAQLAWLKYRDTNCAFVADMYKGGSLRPTVLASCLANVTTNRTTELQTQIKERTF